MVSFAPATGDNAMTDDEIRAYVNSELSGLKKRHSGIEIEHDEGRWTILLYREGGQEEKYTVEARPEHWEFVIWYGHCVAGAFDIRDPSWLRMNLFNRAVHVYFPEVLPERLSDEIRDAASLGSVLEQMLSDPKTYPPNYFSST
jgi:hypothetical protein